MLHTKVLQVVPPQFKWSKIDLDTGGEVSHSFLTRDIVRWFDWSLLEADWLITFLCQ